MRRSISALLEWSFIIRFSALIQAVTDHRPCGTEPEGRAHHATGRMMRSNMDISPARAATLSAPETLAFNPFHQEHRAVKGIRRAAIV